jgi:hypothetical protein
VHAFDPVLEIVDALGQELRNLIRAARNILADCLREIDNLTDFKFAGRNGPLRLATNRRKLAMNCQARREASSRSALALRRRICKTAWRKERAADFANAAGASLALLSGGLGGLVPGGCSANIREPQPPSDAAPRDARLHA